MNQTFSGYRYVDIVAPALEFATLPIETVDVYERPAMVFTPAGWETSHIDALASNDGVNFTRVWSTNVTATHFITSIAASQAMIFFSTSHRGAFRYFQFYLVTLQSTNRTFTVLFIDDYFDDDSVFKAPRLSLNDEITLGGGKA